MQKLAPRKRKFGALYTAITLLSLHWAVVLYINSSFLDQFFGDATIGILYTTGAALTIVAFLVISGLLHKFGNFYTTIGLSVLECTVLLGMAFTTAPLWALIFFVLHQATVPLLLFSLDIYMESLIGEEEESTGGKRGLFLGVMSFAGAIAPLAAGYLVGDDDPNFTAAYVTGALLMLPFIGIIMYSFKAFIDPTYTRIAILKGIKEFWAAADVRRVFCAHFLLQLFFSWMVIYAPIYFSKYIGFNWEEIGLILFVGLLAYVFFEYPIGIIADKWIGEKEMMIAGFVLLGASTLAFALFSAQSILLWMIIVFITRVGASFVEVTTESYFFKHTRGGDTNVISLFRITRPLSYVLGALAASTVLYFAPFVSIFIVLSIAMIPGIIWAALITDTK